MIIRPTTEKHGKYDVFLIGQNANALVRHYFDDATKEYIECPLDNATIARHANLSYTNKDGKVYYTQKGETSVISVGKNAIITKHVCDMGAKKEKQRTFLAVSRHSTIKKAMETGAFYPDLKLDANDDADLISAIKELK